MAYVHTSTGLIYIRTPDGPSVILKLLGEPAIREKFSESQVSEALELLLSMETAHKTSRVELDRARRRANGYALALEALAN